jgi:ATP-dependent exoDNAse (exonuclease V) beta subunit
VPDPRGGGKPMTPTESQKEAIEFEGSGAIVAAAGSGKTFVIVEKITRLAEKMPIEKILAVTFTDKAANELKERVASRLKLKTAAVDKGSIGTIHSFAASLLKLYGEAIGIDPKFEVLQDYLSRLDRLQTVRKTFLSFLEARNPEGLDLLDRYGFHKAIRLLADLIPLSSQREIAVYPALLKKIRQEIETKKRSQNLLDFNDLEEKALELLSIEKYRTMLQERHPWIIVDEFQDTSPIQWKILSQLHQPEKNRLVIVGDPRQSIYRFRGADPSLFQKVGEKIEKEGGKIFYLNENFRSSQAVVAFANRAGRDLFADRFPPLLATRENAGEVEVLPTSPETAAEKLLTLKKEGIAWDSVALLFRTRKAIPLFEEALKAKKIPYETNVGEPLLERPEILSLIYLMKKIAGPGESEKKLVDTALQLSPLASYASSYSGETADCLPDDFFEKVSPFFDKKVQKNIGAFESLYNHLVLFGGKNLKTVLSTLTALREEEAKISAPSEKEEGGKVRLMTIHAAKGLEFPVVFLCDLYARPASPTKLYLAGEKEGVVLRENDPEAEGLKNKLAKSELFETLEKKEKEAELEESQRLLYVALTRAKDRLVFLLNDQKKSGKVWGDWIYSYLELESF